MTSPRKSYPFFPIPYSFMTEWDQATHWFHIVTTNRYGISSQHQSCNGWGLIPTKASEITDYANDIH